MRPTNMNHSREAICNNESVRYLVDDAVVEYIVQNKLYLSGNSTKWVQCGAC